VKKLVTLAQRHHGKLSNIRRKSSAIELSGGESASGGMAYRMKRWHQHGGVAA
jgi:hypothetical protein